MKPRSRISSSTTDHRSSLMAFLLTWLASAGTFAAVVGPGAFSPNASLVNFDNLAGGSSIFTGEIVTNQYSSLGVTFVNPDFVSRANANLAASLTGHSDPNILFIQQHGTNGSGRPQLILFASPVLRVGAFFETSLNSTITMSAFSPAGVLLESATLAGSLHSPGSSFLTGLVGLEEPDGIGHIELFSRSSNPALPNFNFGIDDLEFEAVPEPGTLTWVALGLVGATLRCRRRVRPRALCGNRA